MTTKNDNATTFEEKNYDVSMSMGCFLLFCPFTFRVIPYKTTLHLGTEEVNLWVDGIEEALRRAWECCARQLSLLCLRFVILWYVPLVFAFLVIVALWRNLTRKYCYCCCLHPGDICPGCGCDAEKVDELVEDLKARQLGRGDTAQIRKAEQTLDRLDEIESKLDKIMDHLKIDRV